MGWFTRQSKILKTLEVLEYSIKDEKISHDLFVARLVLAKHRDEILEQDKACKQAIKQLNTFGKALKHFNKSSDQKKRTMINEALTKARDTFGLYQEEG